MKLSNKIVLITGGTSGIGLEAAKLFREAGATVIIVGQNRTGCNRSRVNSATALPRFAAT